MDARLEGEGEGERWERRRWRDVYRYAFSSSLTDVVGALQVMQRFTKEICGEVGFAGSLER